VGLDLETFGKRERQRGLGTWISPHRVERLPELRGALERARLFARVNPVHDGTGEEVERLVAGGVEVLMLPMFHGPREVERFAAAVDGRAEIVLLLETREGSERIEEIAVVDGVGEVHVGINDLALALGMRNRFEVYDSVLVERASEAVRAAGRRFGIGGIGRVGDDALPLPSELLYPQYPRLGATAALISRAFTAGDIGRERLREEVARARGEMRRWFGAGAEALERAHHEFRRAVAAIPSW
jgi:hypothetical protein